MKWVYIAFHSVVGGPHVFHGVFDTKDAAYRVADREAVRAGYGFGDIMRWPLNTDREAASPLLEIEYEREFMEETTS